MLFGFNKKHILDGDHKSCSIKTRYVYVQCWQVYQTSWWMGAYKAATMKRHIAWSNCKSVECLNLGVMTREMQRRLFAHAPKSAKSYRSRDGKKSYVGTKFLKHTQTLVLVFQRYTSSRYYYEFVCVSAPESSQHYMWLLSTTVG